MKVCKVCDIEKNENEFYTYHRNLKLRLHNSCKICSNQVNKIYREKNHEVLHEKRRKRLQGLTGILKHKKIDNCEKIVRKKSCKGSGTKMNTGYRLISEKNHPNSYKNGRLLEHIFVMSNHLGRPLYKSETVHHKNGIRDDNRLENLELWASNHPAGQRVSDLVIWAEEILRIYK